METKGSTILFSEECRVAYQIQSKAVHNIKQVMFDLVHIPDLFGWVKRSNTEVVPIQIW